MGRPKSLIKNVQVTVAGKAHSCKANKSHRISKGDRRLTIKEGQSTSHYCLECGRRFVQLSVEHLGRVASGIDGV